ncbi:hypothetical protein OAQ04_01105 [Flavobacteriaceae bacterium]|nr:hypothetical protein [Flavobacteriaceae bacterium]
MENSFQSSSIKLKNLVLWDENVRFPDKYSDSTEEKLIEYFLSKKDFKISDFIEEIAKDIDLPQLEKIVVWNDEVKYIVLIASEFDRIEATLKEYNTVVFKAIPILMILASLVLVFVDKPLWRAISITTIAMLIVILLIDGTEHA